MDSHIMLKAEHLVKKYGKGENTVTALDDVSIEILKGEFVSVTGESGSGKTTLLNILGSLDKPDSGNITVKGKSLIGMTDRELSAYRRRKTGFIFQNYNLIPVLNVLENIMLPLDLDNAKPDNNYLNELLEITGLADKKKRFPHELSGGQQQRVAFVRALIHKPEIIFADEPTGNLDYKTSRDIIAILKNSVVKYNQALVLITHDQSISSQADSIYEMDDGKIRRNS